MHREILTFLSDKLHNLPKSRHLDQHFIFPHIPKLLHRFISRERSQDPRESLKYLSSSSPITLLHRFVVFFKFRKKDLLCFLFEFSARLTSAEETRSREELHISEKQAQPDTSRMFFAYRYGRIARYCTERFRDNMKEN